MVPIFMMSPKLATLCLLKIKVFSSKSYNVIILTRKFLSRNTSYIVDVIMWRKFGNFSIFRREVINLIFIKI